MKLSVTTMVLLASMALARPITDLGSSEMGKAASFQEGRLDPSQGNHHGITRRSPQDEAEEERLIRRSPQDEAEVERLTRRSPQDEAEEERLTRRFPQLEESREQRSPKEDE